MIECRQCGWSTDKELDLWSDPIPLCPKCGSADLEYLRDKECDRYCCLNCDKFREMLFAKINEVVQERVLEMLQEATEHRHDANLIAGA